MSKIVEDVPKERKRKSVAFSCQTVNIYAAFSLLHQTAAWKVINGDWYFK